MTDEASLAIIRSAYARQVMAASVCTDAPVEAALAAVKREAFLGPGPWPMVRAWRGYVPTPSADPVYLYTDDLVGISPERHINNGQPSLHSHLLSSTAIRPGDHVVHVGAGLGYYSALMAELAGPSGRVTAIEYEPDLAVRAAANLAAYPTVSVVQGDGTVAPFAAADVIYVNAGATGPASAWLDGLRDGGRLMLPLTTDKGFLAGDPANVARQGAVFVLTRAGQHWDARWVSGVAIYPCQGMRDPAEEQALAAAFAAGDPRRVRCFHRTPDVADALCWAKAPGWCLSYE